MLTIYCCDSVWRCIRGYKLYSFTSSLCWCKCQCLDKSLKCSYSTGHKKVKTHFPQQNEKHPLTPPHIMPPSPSMKQRHSLITKVTRLRWKRLLPGELPSVSDFKIALLEPHALTTQRTCKVHPNIKHVHIQLHFKCNVLSHPQTVT